MNFRIAALNIYLPQFLKVKKLNELFSVTADAFQTPAASVAGLPFERALKAYVTFTRDASLQHLNRNGDVELVRRRMYEGACRMGAAIRGELRIKDFAQAMKAARLLYRAIGIDFHGNERGEIVINACYFSRFYTGGICRFISTLDEGLIAGLSGGGHLTFLKRITEGDTCCLGIIERGSEHE